MVKPKELLTPENLNLAASGMITTGSALLTYVILESVTQSVITATEPDPNLPRKREKNLIKAARKSIKDTWNEYKEHPLLLAASVAVLPVGVIYYSYETARHMYQYVTQQASPLDAAGKAALAFLRKVVKLHAYFIAGSVLFAAGWSLWLTLNPQVVMTAITSLGNLGEKAIDEISQIIEGSYSWVPDELSVVG